MFIFIKITGVILQKYDLKTYLNLKFDGIKGQIFILMLFYQWFNNNKPFLCSTDKNGNHLDRSQTVLFT